ncbi:MAG: hypothetical protein HY755_09200 [Nitrospirae bacterium]|nr:hypothetical protein [Nitrospirota bacterium]
MTPNDVHWSLLGAFWSSIIAGIIAVSATIINYLFFRSQVDPHVVVYATHDDKRPSIILLIIENIGKSVAKDVQFEFSKSFPQDAFGFENAPQPQTLSKGPLFTGIPSLGPSAKRIITWGQYGGIYTSLGDGVINVKVRFKGDLPGSLFPKKYTVNCPLDIKSFEHTDASDHNWDKKSSEHLKRIADTLDKIANRK